MWLILDAGMSGQVIWPDCGRSPNSPGLCSSNSPGPGRVLILVAVRGPVGDDTPGTLVRAVARSVHEDLVAVVYEPVEQ